MSHDADRLRVALMRFALRRRLASRPAPRIPDGERVYAIGDVHGRLDLATDLVARIRTDTDGYAGATTIVFLGDLIDRGPDPIGVITFVRELERDTRFQVRHLIGNHEEVLLRALRGDARAARLLMRIGGADTVRGIGISEQEAAAGGFGDLAALLRQRRPDELLAFLDRGEDVIGIGDYAFVHAGIKPGVPIDAQTVANLRWIRDEFLDCQDDHGRMIVHGHTVVDEVEQHANRIAVDTGAYRTGRLSAIALEGDRRWVLTARGIATDAA